MNDYKELIDALDGMDFFCDRAGKELWFDKPKEVQDKDIAFHHETLAAAIKAIEQQKAAIERLEAENCAKEQYIAETIGKLARERKRDDEIIASLQKELVEAAKERDAAIAFVPRVCKTCKRDGLQYLAGGKLDSLCDTCRRNRRCNWEWRGVQEASE